MQIIGTLRFTIYRICETHKNTHITLDKMFTTSEAMSWFARLVAVPSPVPPDRHNVTDAPISYRSIFETIPASSLPVGGVNSPSDNNVFHPMEVDWVDSDSSGRNGLPRPMGNENTTRDPKYPHDSGHVSRNSEPWTCPVTNMYSPGVPDINSFRRLYPWLSLDEINKLCGQFSQLSSVDVDDLCGHFRSFLCLTLMSSVDSFRDFR